jgi:hypothetical protein
MCHLCQLIITHTTKQVNFFRKQINYLKEISDKLRTRIAKAALKAKCPRPYETRWMYASRITSFIIAKRNLITPLLSEDDLTKLEVLPYLHMLLLPFTALIRFLEAESARLSDIFPIFTDALFYLQQLPGQCDVFTYGKWKNTNDALMKNTIDIIFKCRYTPMFASAFILTHFGQESVSAGSIFQLRNSTVTGIEERPTIYGMIDNPIDILDDYRNKERASVNIQNQSGQINADESDFSYSDEIEDTIIPAVDEPENTILEIDETLDPSLITIHECIMGQRPPFVEIDISMARDDGHPEVLIIDELTNRDWLLECINFIYDYSLTYFRDQCVATQCIDHFKEWYRKDPADTIQLQGFTGTLNYWKSIETTKTGWNKFAIIAKILRMVGSSEAVCERIFSKVHNIVGDRRDSLSTEHIEDFIMMSTACKHDDVHINQIK